MNNQDFTEHETSDDIPEAKHANNTNSSQIMDTHLATTAVSDTEADFEKNNVTKSSKEPVVGNHSQKIVTGTPQYTDDEYIAALIIQNQYRNHLSKRMSVNEHNAACVIQSHFRHHLKKQLINKSDAHGTQSEQKDRDAEFGERNDAVIKIQRQYRAYVNVKRHNETACNSKQQNEIHLAERCDNVDDDKVDMDNHLAVPTDALHVRFNDENSEIHGNVYHTNINKADQESAAITIQRQFRNHKNRKKRDNQEKLAAVKIQLNYRNHLERKRQNSAAVKIQRSYRNHFEQKRQNNAAVKIQRSYRNHFEQKRQNNAAVVIQRSYRNHIELNRQNNAAVKIQCSYRNHFEQKRQNNAAVKIQRSYRNHFEQKRQNAAVMIQRSYRNHTESNRQTNAAIQIQRRYRDHFEQIRRKNAAVKIQHSYRNYLARKGQNNAAIKIRHRCDNNLVELNNAAIKIQRSFRNHFEQKRQNNAAIKIQRKYRYYLQTKKKKPEKEEIQQPKKQATKKIVPIKKKAAQNICVPWNNKKANSGKNLKAVLVERQNIANEKPHNANVIHKKTLGVRESIELKREERKKHLKTKEKKAGKVDGAKEVNSPVQEKQDSLFAELEPELVILRESTENKTPSIDILTVKESRDTQSLLSAKEDEYPHSFVQAPVRRPLAYDYAMFYNSYPGGNTAARSGKRRNVSPRSHRSAVPALGNLDSYSVQNMLRKNEVSMLQRRDNTSYLHTYLRQTRVVRNDDSQRSRRSTRATKRQYRYEDNARPDLLPSRGLEKIAHYGRNNTAGDTRTFVDVHYQDKKSMKGASRGTFYPVIPSYGKHTRENSAETELKELPWPIDYG